MGNTTSSSSTCSSSQPVEQQQQQQQQSLLLMSTKEVAKFVNDIGTHPKYKELSTRIIEWGIDGEYLVHGIKTLEELEEALDSLIIIPKLQKQILINKWFIHARIISIHHGNSSAAADDKVIAYQGNRSPSTTGHNGNSNKKNNHTGINTNGNNNNNNKNFLSERAQKAIDAAKVYGWDEDTPDEELEGIFGNIIDLVLDKSNEQEDHSMHYYYAGVHLLNEKGHVALVSRWLSSSSSEQQQPTGHGDNLSNNNGGKGRPVLIISKKRSHATIDQSTCYQSLLQDPNPLSDDLIIKELPSDAFGDNGGYDDNLPFVYVGRKFRNQNGDNVGMICTVKKHATTAVKANGGKMKGQQSSNHVVDDTAASTSTALAAATTTDPQEKELMDQMAVMAEAQLCELKSLRNRNQQLRSQIDREKAKIRQQGVSALPPLGEEDDNFILLPAERDPSLDAVTKQQIKDRPHDFLYPAEVEANGGKSRSAKFDAYQELFSQQPTTEMEHLHPNYFDAMDEANIDRTPLAKDDLQRSAVAEDLKLWELDSRSTYAANIKKLVVATARLFHLPWVHVNTLTSNGQYSIARHYELQGDMKGLEHQLFSVLSADENGCPFVCEFKGGRSTAICNYPVAKKRTFVIHDITKDESFSHYPLSFYAGCPIFYKGFAVATLCMLDVNPRPDFKREHEVRGEQIAKMISTIIENWALTREMECLEKERALAMSILGKAKSSFPLDRAALIFTDVQGSTTLWEANPNAMKEALHMHDKIMRKCCAENFGAEVKTEGDAFHIAFHDAVDAISFALSVQEELFDAPWSNDILALEDACYDAERSFRGLRVRIGIHFGDVKWTDNPVNKKKEYFGKTCNITKQLEHMAHGGQILVTQDVWNQASFLADSKLKSPQILDLGCHVIYTGKRKHDGVVTKEIFQLLPSRLASRTFPPALTTKQLTPSYHEAPSPKDGQVTFAFIYAGKVEETHGDASLIVAFLAKRIGAILGRGPGYQCDNFMLAFNSVPEAVEFGLILHEWFHRTAQQDLLQVGIHRGEVTAVEPHTKTGRADYFGKAVNRCARVASMTPPGKVCAGVVKDEPFLLPEYATSLVGTFSLKGVKEDMNLHSCTRR